MLLDTQLQLSVLELLSNTQIRRTQVLVGQLWQMREGNQERFALHILVWCAYNVDLLFPGRNPEAGLGLKAFCSV